MVIETAGRCLSRVGRMVGRAIRHNRNYIEQLNPVCNWPASYGCGYLSAKNGILFISKLITK